MAACMDLHPCILNALKSLHVNLGRCDQRLAKGRSKFIIISVKRFLCHLKNLADKGETVAVYAGGCHSNENISCIQVLSCDQVLLIHYANCEASQVILVYRIKSRHFCCLAADQCCAGLAAAFCNAFYDLSDLLRYVFAARNIVKEEKRLSACTCNIIYTHCNTVDSHSVMLVHNKCQLQLGSYTVCTGNQCWLLHVLKAVHGKST